MEVERKNALRLTEKLKAEQLSKATVQYETQVQDSNAALYSRQKAAEATLYEQVKSAEARKAQADAKFFEQKLAEDARLYAKQKEAEALNIVGKAKAEYVSSMLDALGGNYNALRDYLMIDSGMYQEMARINASAVSGMQPKISIWNNNGGEAGVGAGAGGIQQMADLYKMLPPLMSSVHEQTGMQPPAWMGSLNMARYVVAGASEYLAITGWGIDDVKLAKKAWVFPGQLCTKIDITPVVYEFSVEAMSSEFLAFKLPAVFTIGPKSKRNPGEEEVVGDLQQRQVKECDEEALLLYAKLIAPLQNKNNHIAKLVNGVIEGETRVLAASMTMEEIFQGGKIFKDKVFNQVQCYLDQFGLYIYNANIKQLEDEPGHEFFYLGLKKQKEVERKALVDSAEANMKGAIGEKERDGLTRQNAAKVDAETKVLLVRQQGVGRKEEAKVKAEVEVYENEREAETAMAHASLEVKKAGFDKRSKVAEVEAVKAIAIREAELQMEVERKNAMRLTEKLKAEQLSKATVQDSNAELYNRQKAAEATLFEHVKSAEACKAQADAKFFEQKMVEDARLYAKQREAESLAKLGKAKAQYVSSMLHKLGGN
uniref:Flotillin-like n=1 Tax=Leersia perrieri TaxID=77586 RepID=A0A0D9XKR8_9ORYZ